MYIIVTLSCLPETEQGKISLRGNEFLNVILTVSLIHFAQFFISYVDPTLSGRVKVGSKISLISILPANKSTYVDLSKIRIYVLIQSTRALRSPQLRVRQSF